MRLYDITHAYQPFDPELFYPDWVESNLREIFLPLSQAMKKGIVKKHVQLQGWTIDAFLNSPDPVRSLSQEFLDNLRSAAEADHIRLGFSGYSHPILPFLSDEVFVRSIKEDYAAVAERLGEPTWFWFPEGACDQRSLALFFKEFPEVYAVIPDGCLGKQNFSGFFTLGGGGRVAVCNSALKDLFMEAYHYDGPQPYSPEGLSQKTAERMFLDGRSLVEGLRYFGGGEAVLARDLENSASKDGLFEFEKGSKELKSLYEARDKIEFALLDEADFSQPLAPPEIRPSSWEPRADKENPYPSWNLDSWKEFVETFCRIYREYFSKRHLTVLASDIPWHILAREEWGPNPEHSQHFVREVVTPLVREIGEKDLIGAAESLEKDLAGFSANPRTAAKGPQPSF